MSLLVQPLRDSNLVYAVELLRSASGPSGPPCVHLLYLAAASLSLVKR